MSMSNMSGGSCAAARLTSWFRKSWCGATTRTLRPKPPMSLASMSPAQQGHCTMRGRKAIRSSFGASAGLSEVAQCAPLDRPGHDYKRHGTTTLLQRSKSPPERSCATHSKRRAASSFSISWTASPRLFRTASFMSFSTTSTPTRKTNIGSRPPQCAISFHADQRVLAQSGRGMVLDLARAVAQRGLLHKPQQLQEHIDAYINAYNVKAEPFVWTKKKKVRQRRFKGRRITQLWIPGTRCDNDHSSRRSRAIRSQSPSSRKGPSPSAKDGKRTIPRCVKLPTLANSSPPFWRSRRIGFWKLTINLSRLKNQLSPFCILRAERKMCSWKIWTTLFQPALPSCATRGSLPDGKRRSGVSDWVAEPSGVNRGYNASPTTSTP